MKPLTPLLLRQLATGESATIVHLDVDLELRKRLVALGMRVGKVVKVIRRAAFGGPIHIRIGTTEIILRTAEAARISVTPYATAT
ncbi:MAG: hypothetical protein RL404_1906 [Pseudomonadota bacterium]